MKLLMIVIILVLLSGCEPYPEIKCANNYAQEERADFILQCMQIERHNLEDPVNNKLYSCEQTAKRVYCEGSGRKDSPGN